MTVRVVVCMMTVMFGFVASYGIVKMGFLVIGMVLVARVG